VKRRPQGHRRRTSARAPITYIIRTYIAGKLSEEEVIAARSMEDLYCKAEKHFLTAMRYPLHMIEVECLNPRLAGGRFLRIGSDPSLMVNPMQVEI